MRAKEDEDLTGDQGNPQLRTVLSYILHRLPAHVWVRLQHIPPDGWKVGSLASFGVARVDKSRDGIFHRAEFTLSA